MISFSYAVTHPRAVMVHTLDALIAESAVVEARVLHQIAFIAVSGLGQLLQFLWT